MVDFSDVPIRALSTATKFLISVLLNPIKVIPNENRYPRDYRGLADLFDIGGEILSDFTHKPNPTEALLNYPSVQESTIEKLQIVLEQIGRWDVIEDTKFKITEDASKYIQIKNKKSAEVIDVEVDNRVLTYGDQHRLSEGLEFEHYDAFLLYGEDDDKKAMGIVENLEREYHLNICDKNRDVINCDITTVITLIAERCNRLIVIVSPSFLQSFENTLLMNFAATLGAEKQMRKIVPVAYERVAGLPPLLKYSYILTHDRLGVDFYKRLAASVKFIKGSGIECSQSANEKILELIANENSIEQLKDINKNPQNEKELELKSMKVEIPKKQSQLKRTKKKLVNFICPQSLRTKFQRSNEVISDTLNLPSVEGLDNLEIFSPKEDSKTKKKMKKETS